MHHRFVSTPLQLTQQPPHLPFRDTYLHRSLLLRNQLLLGLL